MGSAVNVVAVDVRLCSVSKRRVHRKEPESMSVTLINIFEVPAGDEDAFIAAWEKTRDYLMKLSAHVETALHQSLHDERFRFVNIAQWTSEEEFNDAIRSQGFRPHRGQAAVRSPRLS
jgi:heme oxygenase (mycobilin-producing)